MRFRLDWTAIQQCTRLRRQGWRLLEALLPRACALCGDAAGEAVCPACCAEICRPRPRCRVCANPLPATAPGLCAVCIRDGRAFDATVAAADYAEPLSSLMLQLKFGGQLALAPWCALRLRDALLDQPDVALPDCLCPVPLGPQRLRERGFNQALEIARPLAAMLGLPLQPALAQRVRDTAAQSALGPGQRRANLHQAFALTAATMSAVAGRHVGIVDDVMSSGHTVHALATVFKRHGAARVSVFVVARTPP